MPRGVLMMDPIYIEGDPGTPSEVTLEATPDWSPATPLDYEQQQPSTQLPTGLIVAGTLGALALIYFALPRASKLAGYKRRKRRRARR